MAAADEMITITALPGVIGCGIAVCVRARYRKRNGLPSEFATTPAVAGVDSAWLSRVGAITRKRLASARKKVLI
jgi:hypothetical protein